MPLFLLRSAMERRLWLPPRLLLASFFRLSSKVSWFWPWPLGLPTTSLAGAGRYLEEQERQEGKALRFLHRFLALSMKNDSESRRHIAGVCACVCRLYPLLCCMAALLASALSLSRAGSCINWSLFTALPWNVMGNGFKLHHWTKDSR